MAFLIPESAVEYGFRLKPGGPHGSMTMMLRELRLLFAASMPDTTYEELRRLVIQENVLLKDTLSNRQQVFRRLSELYGLRQEIRLYRVLRALWQAGEQEQPLLAVLCALARDPLLRCTAPIVFDAVEGSILTSQMLEAAIANAFPDRYSPSIRASTSRHALSTWTQAGHIVAKSRHCISAGPASAAYALLLAYLCGAHGTFLFDADWVQGMDATSGAMDSLAFAASQRGWLDYRRIGNVADIGFSSLMQV